MIQHRIELITYKHDDELIDALDQFSEEGWEVAAVRSDKYNDYWGNFSTSVILRRSQQS